MEHDRRQHNAAHRDSGRRVSARVVASLAVVAAVLVLGAVLRPASGTALASTPLPAKMRSVPAGCRQIVVITGAKLGSKSGTLALYDRTSSGWKLVFSTPADFGANGLVNGTTRKQGHLQTPTGIWSLGSFVFGEPLKAPTGTKMPYRHITTTAWWSAEPNSTYNTWVSSSRAIAGERLAASPIQYHYAVNTGFNALPNTRVVGRGTAIFIHCSEPAGNALGRYTHGCVAIPRAVMTRLVTALDPALHPRCVIGTLASGTSTSIYAY